MKGTSEGEGYKVWSANFKDNDASRSYTVKGKYKGNEVTVPAGQNWICTGVNSRFAANDGRKIGNLDNGNTSTTLTEKDLFDFRTYGNPAKTATYEFRVALAKTKAARTGLETAIDAAATGAAGVNSAAKLNTFNTEKTNLLAAVNKLEVTKESDATDGSLAAAKKDFAALKTALEADPRNTAAGWTGDAEAATKAGNFAAAVQAFIEKFEALTGSTATSKSIAKNYDEFVATMTTATSGLEDQLGDEPGNPVLGQVYKNKPPYTTVKTAVGYLVNRTKNPYVAALNDVYKKLEEIRTNGNMTAAVKGDQFAKAVEAVDALDFTDETAVANAKTAINAIKVAVAELGADVNALTADNNGLIDEVVNTNYISAKKLYNTAVEMSGKVLWTSNYVAVSNDPTRNEGTAPNIKYAPGNIAAAFKAVDGKLSAITPGEDAGAAFVAYVQDKQAEDALALVESKVTTIYKEVKISAEPAYAKKIVMDTSKTLNPKGLEIATIPGNNANDYTPADGEVSKTKAVVVLSQYNKILPNEKIVYNVTEYKEATDRNTHVVDSFKIKDNGSEHPVINGAEIGDSFKITAKVLGKSISETCTVKVGADTLSTQTSAYNDSDKDFRMGKYKEGETLYDGLEMIR